MELPDLCRAAVACIMVGSDRMTLSLEPGAKWPPGFPRGEMLSVGSNGMENRSFRVLKVLEWVQKRAKLMTPNNI